MAWYILFTASALQTNKEMLHPHLECKKSAGGPIFFLHLVVSDIVSGSKGLIKYMKVH